MQAKFQCESVTDFGHQKQAKLRAKYSDNPGDNSFAEATPAGEMSITISNPKAMDFLVPGKSFYLDFTEADE